MAKGVADGNPLIVGKFGEMDRRAARDFHGADHVMKALHLGYVTVHGSHNGRYHQPFRAALSRLRPETEAFVPGFVYVCDEGMSHARQQS